MSDREVVINCILSKGDLFVSRNELVAHLYKYQESWENLADGGDPYKLAAKAHGVKATSDIIRLLSLLKKD